MKSLMAAKCTTQCWWEEKEDVTRAPLSGNGLSQEMARRTGPVSNTTKHSTTSTSLSSLAPLVQALSLPPPQQSTVPQYTYNSPGSSIDHYKKSTINTSFVFPTSLDTTWLIFVSSIYIAISVKYISSAPIEPESRGISRPL